MAATDDSRAEFAGRVALVTGAGAGIGRAVCRRLAAGGATVVPTDRHVGRLREVADELADLRPGAVGMAAPLDIEHRADFDRVFAEVEATCGGLDLYVWNAALNLQQPIFEHDPELFDRILYANVNNCWYSCNGAVQSMRRRGGGSIVMVGSVAPDVVATVREPPYAISKAAGRALMLGIAKAGGPLNVRCNEVVMGLVTGTRFVDSRPEQAEAMRSDVPLGRHATVEDIAEAVAFLASDRAAFVTGESLNVSGGWYLRL
ncbi:MAG TPA: SDR family oxidoreductase [Acidimicrobiales bacterium]|nr:SDR family oxidoreductase [Acidimicrobiales bacterium]